MFLFQSVGMFHSPDSLGPSSTKEMRVPLVSLRSESLMLSRISSVIFLALELALLD